MFWRTLSEIRPAMASEPPDGSSTVELAWRVLERRDLDVVEHDRALVGELADLGLHLEADAAFRQHHRREGKADAELLELNADLPEAIDDRHGKLAAGEELRRLAGDRRQVRLGQRLDETVALERALSAASTDCWPDCHRGRDAGVAEPGDGAVVGKPKPPGLSTQGALNG